MESYQIENLTFTYPTAERCALEQVSLAIEQGTFVTICGKSGCGKTTLLRHLKPVLAPHGRQTGSIRFMGRPLSELDLRAQSEKIGFVMQSPDHQLVTDKVWHELAFGLESLGLSTAEIRARVAEMASFFGIQTWFRKKTADLSGGQKQLLNLAAIMVMQPAVLILDEPTSQLDPIAAGEFLVAVSKINRELGTTVILTEHRLEEAFAVSDRVVVMDAGRIIADGAPAAVGAALKEQRHEMCAALPTAMRVYAGVPNSLACPVTVRDGRMWLRNMSEQIQLRPECIPAEKGLKEQAPFLTVRDVWFRYDKEQPDVLRGLSMQIYKGEFYAIVGGNGSGKTTALSVISGLRPPYRGEVRIGGKRPPQARERFGMLPQNPQTLFVKKTVWLDLYEMLSEQKLPKGEKDRMVRQAAEVCEIEALLQRHPYDLSGGEGQRAALAKVLLLKPQILLLDEPTKGLDAHFKGKFAAILQRLQRAGVTVVMVSHDIEFCARYADRCAMFFDGGIVSEGTPRTFFSGKRFYTTAANRMARDVLPGAVLAEDIIAACNGRAEDRAEGPESAALYDVPEAPEPEKRSKPALTRPKLFWGLLFAALFLLTVVLFKGRFTDWRDVAVQFATILFLALSLCCLIPQRTLDTGGFVQTPKEKRRLAKRTLLAAAIILLAVPLTIYIGMYFLGDRKYYFISLLIILETLVPFGVLFEQRKPQARELVVISVLCAIAVAGRAAFYMIPQFKPVAAVVIIAGVCFGGETGFLVGAVSGFVSNFFFGQGPWTPWQMFAFGIIGFLAGLLFRKGFLRKTKGSLCIFGGIATVVFYGGIMNPATVLIWQANPNAAAFLSSYLMGLPFDLVHAASTVFFLWFAAAPMIEKLDRIKIKYGIINAKN